MHIAILSTSLSMDSLSRALLHRSEAMLREDGAITTFCDARDLPPELCNGRALEEYPTPYTLLHGRLTGADGVLLGVPIHNSGVSGACLNLLAIVGAGLAGKPVAVVSASGSVRSHLATSTLLV